MAKPPRFSAIPLRNRDRLVDLAVELARKDPRGKIHVDEFGLVARCSEKLARQALRGAAYQEPTKFYFSRGWLVSMDHEDGHDGNLRSEQEAQARLDEAGADRSISALKVLEGPTGARDVRQLRSEAGP